MNESFVEVPGSRLFVRQIGRGTPIVILHGGPDFNHRYLLPEMDGLATAFHLVYFDQRGRGKSSQGVRPEDVSIESEIEDLDQLRQHLGLDTIVLLGHSWGGLLAMEYTARHPGKVSRLILMNTAPGSHADMLGLREHRQAHEAGTLTRMRELAADPAFAAGDLEIETRYYRAHFGAALSRPELVETILGRLRMDFTPADVLKARAIEDRLYEQTWLKTDYDVAARLVRTRTPVLVIHGENDLIPAACAKRIREAVPLARLRLLPDCGHFAYLERPAETFAAIEEFVLGE